MKESILNINCMNTLSARPYTVTVSTPGKKQEQASISKGTSSIKHELNQIRSTTLNQFAKKLSSSERKLVEEVTKNIIDRLSESSETAISNSCMRQHLQNFDEIVEGLFMKSMNPSH